MNVSNTQLLSKRELSVLHLIIDEYTNKEIASILFISQHTVISHRKSIQAKLKAKNTAGIVRRAFEMKFVVISDN